MLLRFLTFGGSAPVAETASVTVFPSTKTNRAASLEGLSERSSLANVSNCLRLSSGMRQAVANIGTPAAVAASAKSLSSVANGNPLRIASSR